MKVIAALAAALIVAAIPAGCERPPAKPTTKPAPTRYDEDYVAALWVADSFCDAWLRRDEAVGRALLSRRMLLKYPDQQLRDAIVGYPNPTHAAYEIANGRRLSDGRYAFDVRLFYRYAGGHADRLESPKEQIVVVNEDGDRWRVDEFPVPQTPKGIR